MDGLLDKHSGERPRASRIVRVRRLDPMKLAPFAGKVKIGSRGGPSLFIEVPAATPVLGPGEQRSARYSKGLQMSIKFEGKPPFYLGIAEVASAHALDGSVVLRATISVPESRPKSVPVQFIVATDVAKALAEQLPNAVRMAEVQKHRRA
jgi:hypothetical protein